MLFTEWNVLLVDDEPDVLTVTKLALRDAHVYGLPLKIHTASSKAEAIEMLHGPLAIDGVPEGSLSVAFIDVVMESEHAGLELCHYIRKELGNRVAQLFIRTGQPGIAPERDVIDQYDISGYFTKVETTEQKLYTFVKSGIRQWYSIYYAKLLAEQTNLIIQHSGSRQQLIDALMPQGEGFESNGHVAGYVFDDGTLMTFDDTREQMEALRDELLAVQPVFTTPEGHTLTIDGNRLMVNILDTPTTSAFWYVADSPMEWPQGLWDITFQNGLAMSTLWKRVS